MVSARQSIDILNNRLRYFYAIVCSPIMISNYSDAKKFQKSIETIGFLMTIVRMLEYVNKFAKDKAYYITRYFWHNDTPQL